MKRVTHILHADDDDDDRWIFQHGLNEYDPAIKLTQFEDGIYLLKYLKTQTPDLNTWYAIICDMQMPAMNGLDVLKNSKIIPAWRETPVIIFSTSSLEDDIRNSINEGALAFYSKPSTFPESRRIISEMMLRCKPKVPTLY